MRIAILAAIAIAVLSSCKPVSALPDPSITVQMPAQSAVK